MKKQIVSALSAILLCAGISQASPIFTTTPADGVVTGTPGSVVGWGFTLASDATYSLSAISAFLVDETNASLGSWNDVISSQGGPDAGLLLPNAPAWAEDFLYDPDLASQTGLGWYQIGAGATAGQVDSGLIHVDFELDSVSADCPGCFVATESVELPFTVTVAAATAPEPGSLLMMLGAFAVSVCCWETLRRRQAGQ